jgi:hypothetical protein
MRELLNVGEKEKSLDVVSLFSSYKLADSLRLFWHTGV